MHNECEIKVQLVGGFKLIAANDVDITPKGTKACALLAILCLTPDRSRSRRWIEAKLWSTRGQAQANASLRQTLSEIRRAFNKYKTILLTDRQSVSLVNDAIVVDIDSNPIAAAQNLNNGRELLEGMDGKDNEFEHWLRNERNIISLRLPDICPIPSVPQVSIKKLEIIKCGHFGPLERTFASTICDQVARNVSENSDISLHISSESSDSMDRKENSICLKCEVGASSEMVHVFLRLEAGTDHQLIWTHGVSILRSCRQPMIDPDLLRLAFEASEVILEESSGFDKNGDGQERSIALTDRALKEMFSFDASRMRVADGLLREALDIYPLPQQLAWRSLLRTLMIVERTEKDIKGLREESADFASRALEAAPRNALVKAVISQAKVLPTDDPSQGFSLAKDAILLNPGNAMANTSMASCLLRAGKPEEALGFVKFAHSLARHSIHRHWWDMFYCLAEISNFNFDAAIIRAEDALVRAPAFRPPLRHLYALYNYQGNIGKLRLTAEKLKKIEPGFSFRRVKEDLSYPAATLRRSPLLEIDDMLN